VVVRVKEWKMEFMGNVNGYDMLGLMRTMKYGGCASVAYVKFTSALCCLSVRRSNTTSCLVGDYLFVGFKNGEFS
jgi:hypothetical protein